MNLIKIFIPLSPCVFFANGKCPGGRVTSDISQIGYIVFTNWVILEKFLADLHFVVKDLISDLFSLCNNAAYCNLVQIFDTVILQ